MGIGHAKIWWLIAVLILAGCVRNVSTRTPSGDPAPISTIAVIEKPAQTVTMTPAAFESTLVPSETPDESEPGVIVIDFTKNVEVVCEPGYYVCSVGCCAIGEPGK